MSIGFGFPAPVGTTVDRKISAIPAIPINSNARLRFPLKNAMTWSGIRTAGLFPFVEESQNVNQTNSYDGSDVRRETQQPNMEQK